MMMAALRLWLVVGVTACAAVPANAQPRAGALAIGERQGNQYGWAVDYETPSAARAAALSECGSGCSVVLTFNRCGAYAADQGADSTAVGWAESYASADGARQAALAECRSRGGSECLVRVWGCNGQVIEEGLNLNRLARRQIQQGLRAEGFDPGGADGVFGPRTRAAIRSWQSSRGTGPTGYLDGPAVEALWSAGGTGVVAPVAAPGAQRASAAVAPAATTVEQENLFWQSVMNSTNPADFEAYQRRFPNGVFSDLAQNRLAAIRGPAGSRPAGAGAVGIGAPTSESRGTGAPARAAGSAAGGDVRAGVVFRPDQTCAGQPAGSACWMEVSRQPGCYVWNPGLALGATVAWTGACAGGLAQGAGTLTWVWDGNRQTATGPLEDGKRNGHWVFRYPNGNVEEGPMVDDIRNGHWIFRFADGSIAEGSNVDGELTGRWVIRNANGTVEEWWYRDGERVR